MSFGRWIFTASRVHNGPLHNAAFSIFGISNPDLISVLLLFCVNFLNYMDRFTIAGIPDMIRNYYHIDSKRLGLLQTSFIISYMFLSPVFGYLGDRWKRKYLMVIGLFVWSVVSLGSSFSFGLFLTLRCIVGVGEASYSTLAPTILTDLFTGNSRTSVLGFFYFAVPVGSGFGYVVGSAVARATGNWAWALRITPTLGLFCLFALIVFHTDPPRGLADGAVHLRTTSWWSDLRSLYSNRCFLFLSVGFTGNCFVLGALSWFSVDYIQDVMATPLTTPLLFGLSACFAGLLGVVVGTSLARSLRAYSIRVDAYISGIGLLLSAPFILAGLIAPIYSFYLCLVLFCIFTILGICFCWTISDLSELSVVVPTRRATANAFQMLMTHAFGDAISPFIIGIQTSNSAMSRYLGMQRALFITVFICILSGFLLLCASWYLEPAKARVQFIIDGKTASGFFLLELHKLILSLFT
ncbi:unnamed protein product [Taenia asiatica]|uniref:MFS domain-containing protein n=1 Tax=Taenia asiatica TaxID=60517 RepID=A0A0R3VU53_TAEAS|nr:unnamed protein product [Taenia asiatica]